MFLAAGTRSPLIVYVVYVVVWTSLASDWLHTANRLARLLKNDFLLISRKTAFLSNSKCHTHHTLFLRLTHAASLGFSTERRQVNVILLLLL